MVKDKLVRLWTTEESKRRLKIDAAKLGLSLVEYVDKITENSKENNEKKKLYRTFI